jgi:hypothetical protein
MKPSVNRLRAGVCVAAAGLACLVLSGCYERVVSARGFGADNVGVSKPNVDRPQGERTLGYPKYSPKPMPGG